MTDDEKTPARQVIADYVQAHFRYFRTAEGAVHAQKNGHPVARPLRSQGTTAEAETLRHAPLLFAAGVAPRVVTE